MKQFTILLLSLTIMCHMCAQVYSPKDDERAVRFSIKNFGLTVNGSFSGLQGAILFDPAHPDAASFKVNIDAATVNTGNSARDVHLKKEEYFNTAIFKKLSLQSSKITNSAGHGTYLFEGVLSIKGINKIISFPFTAISNADGYQFTGSFKINRRDFKVGGNSLVLSDSLTVFLNVAAKKI